MRNLLLAMMLLPGSPADPVLTLELGAETWGEFRTMHTSAEPARKLVLEDGRLRGGFLELWWPGTKAAIGSQEKDPALCEGKRVTVAQTIGRGLRARTRSWTVMDACPVAWEVAAIGDDGELRVTSLTFAGREIAVSR